MKTLARAALLVLLASACAAGFNAVRPNGLPWRGDPVNDVVEKARAAGVKTIDADEARRIIDAGEHLVLDARPASKYHEGHLPGALSLPAESVAESYGDVAALVAPDVPILVYCTGALCDESLQVAEFLRQQGCENVTLFLDGFDAWHAAGLPVEREEPTP